MGSFFEPVGLRSPEIELRLKNVVLDLENHKCIGAGCHPPRGGIFLPPSG